MLKLAHFISKKHARLIFCLVPLALPALTHAELNGDVSSVEADRVHVAGTLTKTTASSWTVYEIKDPNGGLIREYVSLAGRVFAIAWEGHFAPELKQFLGPFFLEYSRSAQSTRAQTGLRRQLSIHLPNLVFETGGHMGWHYGRAYLPELLPRDVMSEVIR